jgi:hypothetical protein
MTWRFSFTSLLFLLVAGTVGSSGENETDPWRGAAQKPKTKYDATVASARKEYDRRLAGAKSELLSHLKDLGRWATRTGELDAALALRAARGSGRIT